MLAPITLRFRPGKQLQKNRAVLVATRNALLKMAGI
jgi:hypothetical protein